MQSSFQQKSSSEVYVFNLPASYCFVTICFTVVMTNMDVFFSNVRVAKAVKFLRGVGLLVDRCSRAVDLCLRRVCVNTCSDLNSTCTVRVAVNGSIARV